MDFAFDIHYEVMPAILYSGASAATEDPHYERTHFHCYPPHG